jgi:ATP adenylyltransferase
LNENTEFYRYQHWTKTANIQSKCPFCKLSPKLELIAETPLSYAVQDVYPVTKGHTLIVPKRHVANYFDLAFDEQKDLVQLSNFLYKKYLRPSIKPRILP